MALMELQTTDQVLKQLQEVASKSEDRSFRLKISRKLQNQMIPTVIATLDGAEIEHLANPETWLAQLAGGGDYFLHASHISNRAVSFGPIQVKMAGEVNAVDPFADTKPDWRGPREIVVPTKPKQQQDPNAFFTSVGVTEPQGASPRNDRPQGSGSVAPASIPQGDPLAIERMRVQQQLDELNRRTAAAAEERHRTEIELERKRQALELATLEARLKAEQPKGESAADRLLMIMREEAKQREEREEARRREEREREDRRLEAERIREEKRQEADRIREEKRIEREREDRREREAERARLEERLAAERKAANEQFMMLMQKLNDKPAIDPMIQKMLDAKENQATETMKIMAPMMEMAGQNMNMMVQMIHTVAELQGGNASESDPPIVKLVGKIVDGIQAAAAAGRGPALRLPAPPAPRAPRPPPARPVNEAPPAPAPEKAQALGDLDPTVPAPAPSPPLKVVPPPTTTAMEQIIAMIKAHHDPEQVAHFFFQNATDPSIAKPLAAANMQILGAFAPYLMPWLTGNEANQNYVRNLFDVVNAVAPQYDAALDGMPEEEEGEEESDEEGEEEGEELEAEEPTDVTPKAAQAAKEKK